MKKESNTLNTMDKILDYKTALCDKYEIALGARCLITDLIFAAATVGKVEALDNLQAQFWIDTYKKSLGEKMDRLKKYLDKKD